MGSTVSQVRTFNAHSSSYAGQQSSLESSHKMPDVSHCMQGSHETGIAHKDATYDDLLHLKTGCKKNPGHKMFMPEKKFNKEALPKPYRDDEVYQYVLRVLNLIVNIFGTIVSEKRPKNHGFKGGTVLRFGTGLVISVTKNNRCACPLSPEYAKQKLQCWIVQVVTANHVVFNTEEAEHVTAKVYFNNDNAEISDTKTMRGVRVSASSELGDWAVVDFVTHDEGVAEDLIPKLRHLHVREKRAVAKHLTSPPLAFIVSHPHGCCKQVSNGEWLMNTDHEGVVEQMNVLYNASTCEGSSGAPVILLGGGYEFGHYQCHSKGPRKGESFNRSGSCWKEKV